VLPYRSNIPAISEFVYEQLDQHYVQRAKAAGDHAILGGMNYGQGSSREHAAIAPRFLGLRVVIAKGFARIHWQNLINFGVLPLKFKNADDYDALAQGDVLVLEQLDVALAAGSEIEVGIDGRGERLTLTHQLSLRQVAVLRAGGLINWMRERN
jgi:aconitate hydratase